MEKWEQKLKEHVNPTVPDFIQDRTLAAIHQLPKRKRVSRITYIAASLFTGFSILFGASFLSPTLAETMRSIPVIGSVFDMVGDIGVKKGTDEGLSTLIGEQVNINGQNITFTESLYDGTRIHIGFILENYTAEKGTRPSAFLENLIFTIDGKTIDGYGMGMTGKEMDGNYVGTISISVRDSIPTEFMLGIQSRDGSSQYAELPVEQQGEHKAFLVNELRKTDDLTILYDQITFFPTSTEIAFRQIFDKKAYESNKYMMLDYQVEDNQGRILQPLSGGGEGGSSENGQILQNIKYYFEPLESTPESLTIKPFLYKMTEQSPNTISKKWRGEPLTLSQGEIGQITILDVHENPNHMRIHLKADGDNSFRQAADLWLADDSGTNFYSNDPPSRVEGTVDEYEMTFTSAPSLDQLFINTNEMGKPIYLDDLEITVHLTERK